MQYVILEGTTPEELTGKVLRHLRNGWIVAGGVSTMAMHHHESVGELSSNQIDIMFYQALTRQI